MKKILVLAIGIILLSVTSAFCVSVETMIPALEKTKEGITAVFTSIDADMAAAAKKLSIVGPKSDDARKVLSDLCKKGDYVIDCAIVDTKGVMIAVEPKEYSKYEGEDISKQPQVAVMLQYNRPVLSDVFRSVEGIDAVDFGYPISSSSGEFIGSVSMLVKQQALSQDIIVPLVSYIPCKVWIMQKDGLVVYDPDPQQIGKNIFKDDFYRPFQDLVSFSETVAGSRDGAGSYDFYTKGLEDKTIVKKYAIWDTVSLYGTEWRIIVMEADKPLEKK